MPSLSDALPGRVMRIRRSGMWPGVFSYLGGLMLLGIAGFIGVWQVPGIVNDWMVARDPVAVRDARITDGECHTRRLVFVDCEAHVAYEISDKMVEHDIELMFLDIGSGDYEVDVVRSKSEPSRAALTLGLDMLWNRTLVGAAFILGIGAAGISLFAGGIRTDSNRRRAREASLLRLAPVGVAQINKVIGGRVVQFSYGEGRKKRPLLTTSRFGRKEEPFWLDAGRGVALAAWPEGATVPVLLDAGLARLDATPIEIAKISARLAEMTGAASAA